MRFWYLSHMCKVTLQLFACWVIFNYFVVYCLLFPKLTFSKNSFKNNIRVSNNLDPDQDRHFVGPDLGPNCLPRLSAKNKSPLTRKELNKYAQVRLEALILAHPSSTSHLCKALTRMCQCAGLAEFSMLTYAGKYQSHMYWLIHVMSFQWVCHAALHL